MSIELEHVHKSYGSQPVVRDVNLHIESGELFVLLGASGSGKSTLLRLIAGLLLPDSGRVVLNKRDVTLLPPQVRGTGFVFQNYSLFGHMTIEKNIDFGLSIRRVSRNIRKQRTKELLDLIGLPGYESRLPAQLSGGQQQRVALARALAYEPNVLLLDEPFGALDVKIRVQLRQSLREIQQRLGVTTILVTHDQEEAFDIADRIGVIEQGQLVEVGTPSDLYQRPQHHFTATFLGTTANLLAAQRNDQSVHLGDVNLPIPPHTEHLTGSAVHLMCRPEEVKLFASRSAADGQVIGSGKVESVNFTGAMLRTVINLQAPVQTPLQALISPANARGLGLAVGQELWIGLGEYHLLPVSENS
ncbi:MAG: ABC transporter ATP-binding protein [Chloroflexota bacterium]|nr:ABC transporter ATP-binding protein [Chloroflexota bacterium]